MMSFAETADIDTASEDYARRFSGEAGAYFIDIQTRIVLDLLKSHSGARILDVGGGHAQLAVPLVQNGFDVTVTGSDDICQNRLKKFLPPKSFTYQTCDMLNLPFENQSFDVVLAFRLLPHADQWQNLVAEMCRVAKTAIIVDYPDIRSFNILYRLLFEVKKLWEGNTRPYALFDRSTISSAFLDNGFARPIFKPEFFAPMVVHRMLKSSKLSKNMENVFKTIGLTSLLGSPVVAKFTRP